MWISLISLSTIMLLASPTGVLTTSIMKSVAVELYMESMCPGCKYFEANILLPTWKELKQYINFTAIPFGNAIEQLKNGTYDYRCQHGPNECIGNIIMGCGMRYIPKENHIYYIVCTVQNLTPQIDGLKCAEKYLEKMEHFKSCCNGKEGLEIFHQNAVLTNALQPPHEYVPWVVINGNQSKWGTSNFKKLLCIILNNEPAACHENSY